MYSITAGGATRGTIALGGDGEVEIGRKVQFFHRPASKSPARVFAPSLGSPVALDEDLDKILENHSPVSISTIFTSTDSTHFDSDVNRASPDAVVHPNSFFAASEKGFIAHERLCEDGSRKPWICTVPGAVGVLVLSN